MYKSRQHVTFKIKVIESVKNIPVKLLESQKCIFTDVVPFQ